MNEHGQLECSANNATATVSDNGGTPAPSVNPNSEGLAAASTSIQLPGIAAGMAPALLSYLRRLQGKRTYIVVAIGGALCFGAWQGWWKVPAPIISGLELLAIMFIRAAIANAGRANNQ